MMRSTSTGTPGTLEVAPKGYLDFRLFAPSERAVVLAPNAPAIQVPIEIDLVPTPAPRGGFYDFQEAIELDLYGSSLPAIRPALSPSLFRREPILTYTYRPIEPMPVYDYPAQDGYAFTFPTRPNLLNPAETVVR